MGVRFSAARAALVARDEIWARPRFPEEIVLIRIGRTREMSLCATRPDNRDCLYRELLLVVFLRRWVACRRRHCIFLAL